MQPRRHYRDRGRFRGSRDAPGHLSRANGSDFLPPYRTRSEILDSEDHWSGVSFKSALGLPFSRSYLEILISIDICSNVVIDRIKNGITFKVRGSTSSFPSDEGVTDNKDGDSTRDDQSSVGEDDESDAETNTSDGIPPSADVPEPGESN